MNEFDELCAIRRIRELLLERVPPQEWTAVEIRRRVTSWMRQYGVSKQEAYEALEDKLLHHPPKDQKEDWSS